MLRFTGEPSGRGVALGARGLVVREPAPFADASAAGANRIFKDGAAVGAIQNSSVVLVGWSSQNTQRLMRCWPFVIMVLSRFSPILYA